MIEINDILFFGLLFIMLFVGMGLGLFFTHDYRKELEKTYNQKHQEIYNTIRKETKDEWSKGWDAAFKTVGDDQKAYYLWFREHGYEQEDIAEWLKKYLNKP